MLYELVVNFAKNKKHFLQESTLISYSLFYDLTDGSIVASGPIKTCINYCIFEEIIKLGNGACIETNNNVFVTVSKCTSKCCGVYSLSEMISAGHFCYLNADTEKKTVLISDVSLSLCASSIHSDQRSIIRSSKTDTDCFDVNITNSYSSNHALSFRQYNVTNLKRILVNRIITLDRFFFLEYGSTIVEKMDVSCISVSNDIIIYQNSNTITFTDCSFNITSFLVYSNNSTAIFEKCFFVQNAPCANGVQIRNNVTTFSFGEPILCGGEIFKELDILLRGKIMKNNVIKTLLIKVLFC